MFESAPRYQRSVVAADVRRTANVVGTERTRTVVQGHLERHPTLLPWLDRLEVLIHQHFGIEGATRYEVFHGLSALAGVGSNEEL